MRYLLFTDVHLDDQPQNEYRWLVFEHVRIAAMQYNVDTVFCLGDLVDRKDKFSSAFVNRLLNELYSLSGRCEVIILRGNHDTTIKKPNYFEFLNMYGAERAVTYIVEPQAFNDDLLLLPFSDNPKQEWSSLRLASYKAAFMHATVSGARFENGIVVEKTDFPVLPSKVKFYSGDVHVPQKVRNIVYVGAPHPIKFGDDYPCRMLLLDEAFDIELEIPLSGPRKLSLSITSLDDLDNVDVRPGDQVKIEYALTADKPGGWHLNDAALAAWANARGVTVSGVECVLEGAYGDLPVDHSLSPEAILRQFADHESISDDLLAIGMELLKSTR